MSAIKNEMLTAILPFYSAEETDADRILMLLEDETNSADFHNLITLEAAMLALQAIVDGDYYRARAYAPSFSAYRERCS